MTYEECALRGDYDHRIGVGGMTREKLLEEARVSDLGEFFLRHWPLRTMPDMEGLYALAREIIRGGWRKCEPSS